MLFKLNNDWIEIKEDNKWAKDRGLLLGDGLFETLRIKRSKPLYLLAHWQRLKTTADAIALDLPFNQAEFISAISEAIHKNQLKDAGIRVTVTRGIGERGLIPRNCSEGLALFQPFYLPKRAASFRLMYSSIRRNETSPLTRIKSLSYLEPVLIQQEAVDNGYDDGLCLNTKGAITETSISNFFLIKNDTLITPPISDGILPGIMRAQILSYCHEKGIPAREASVLPDMITTEDTVFLTNVLIGIKRVTSIQSVQLANASLCQTLSKHFDS